MAKTLHRFDPPFICEPTLCQRCCRAFFDSADCFSSNLSQDSLESNTKRLPVRSGRFCVEPLAHSLCFRSCLCPEKLLEEAKPSARDHARPTIRIFRKVCEHTMTTRRFADVGASSFLPTNSWWCSSWCSKLGVAPGTGYIPWSTHGVTSRIVRFFSASRISSSVSQ